MKRNQSLLLILIFVSKYWEGLRTDFTKRLCARICDILTFKDDNIKASIGG
ncbi:hypothetical protein D3C73_709910 [compost metagenome]